MPGVFSTNKETEVSAVECANMERVDEVIEVRGNLLYQCKDFDSDS